jgi:hypothetical protein
MSLRMPLRALTLTLLLLSNSAAAQLPQTKQDSDEEKAKARKELERKALAMLDETLEGAQLLKLAENRVSLRTQGADLLWTRDEKRARSLFRDAAADLASARAGDSGRSNQVWVLSQLRTQLLYTAAAHDPQLALDLLHESHASAPDGTAQPTATGDPDGELRLEQSLAALAAESDPKAALRSAEEGMGKGVTLGVMGTLERLRSKDAEAATRLASKIVEKLRSESLNQGREATMVAASLLRTALLPDEQPRYLYARGLPYRPATEKPKPLVMEDGDLRELADLVAAAALKDSLGMGAFGLMMEIRPMLPELEKRVPARAAQLRQRLAEMDKQLDPRTRAWMNFDAVMEKSTDAMLEEAAKGPSEVRGELYAAAAMKLFQSGETEKARQVVAENLSGQEREQMLAYMDQAEVARAAEKGDPEAIRAVASRIKSKERRAGALAELAVALAAKGDKKAAAQLLEEARGLVDRQPDNQREVQALLEVARGYALVEPAKTFEIIDPLIDQANDMMSAAALLEKFGAGSGAFRKGELILALGLGDVGGTYERYVKALAELARLDFDRTRATADRFNRDEARLMARLIIARSLLSPQPDTSAGGNALASH